MPQRHIFENGVLTDIQYFDLSWNRITESGLPIPVSGVCPHLGAATGELIDCNLCGGGKQIETHYCNLYGVCSPDKRLIHKLSGPNTEVKWCKSCEDNPFGFVAKQRHRAGLVNEPKTLSEFAEKMNSQPSHPIWGVLRPFASTTFNGCTCCGSVASGVPSGFVSGFQCCPSGTLVPTTLHATITDISPGGCCCGCLAGTYTLTWTGINWEYANANGPCSGLGIELIFACLTAVADYSLVITCGPVGAQIPSNSGTCSPVTAQFNNFQPNPPPQSCCSGKVDITIGP